jgi:hypothetical protein
MENMENAGKTHGKKGWKNWEKCRKLMKNYEKWKVHYANFPFIGTKKRLNSGIDWGNHQHYDTDGDGMVLTIQNRVYDQV